MTTVKADIAAADRVLKAAVVRATELIRADRPAAEYVMTVAGRAALLLIDNGDEAAT